MFDVANYASDREPGLVVSQALADWALTGPKLPSDRFVDNHDAGPACCIAVGKDLPGPNRNPQHPKIIRRDGTDLGHISLARRRRVAFDLIAVSPFLAGEGHVCRNGDAVYSWDRSDLLKRQADITQDIRCLWIGLLVKGNRAGEDMIGPEPGRC